MPPVTLLPLDLTSDDFRDRVNGCWMGKNCGGTLGAPLEKAFGEPEPFDVWWYPRLEPGGIPNDDLEMQLFWLKALEEVGPGLRAADLAQYWLDHIAYNFDEYGLCKTNLRLGLLPPVAGTYNNWFKDCMGCPIRSEIWACVAPGAPRVACLYAYEDAIVDHAGGESVYGEFFNAAVASAAFVVTDRDTLIDIGMSYVPESSLTFRAMRAALDAHTAGVDWQEARRRVMTATPNYNSMYSPINLGFQLVGWLYGEDFGDAICKAVNCGYDTDCTGATLGSFLGIMLGRHGLPTKWTEPLGETIATSEKWGGVRHGTGIPNPVPTTIGELTERTIRQAVRVLAWHGVTPGAVKMADLYADDRIRALGKASPMRVEFPAVGHGATLSIGIDYGDGPAVRAGATKTLVTHLANPRLEAASARCRLQGPEGWTVSPSEQRVETAAGNEAALTWEVTAPGPARLEMSNTLYLQAEVEGRPAQGAVPVVLVGTGRFRRSAIYPGGERPEAEILRDEGEPERASGDLFTSEGRPGIWEIFETSDDSLPLEEVFAEPGVLYVQVYVHSATARPRCWFGAPATCPVRVWVNGEFLTECVEYRPFRPNYDGSGAPGQAYAQVDLRAGWNEVLYKFVRGADAPPFACHLVFTETERHNGMIDLCRTRLPWEA